MTEPAGNTSELDADATDAPDVPEPALGVAGGLTVPCPKCRARIVPGAGGKLHCGACGYSPAKPEQAQSGESDLRVVEVFPLEGGRVLCCLRSGVQVVHRVGGADLEAQGEGTPEVCSRRLKVLPRTDGKWIVFDSAQPMARGDVAICSSLHAACKALGQWVEREKSPAGIPMRDPVPRPPPIYRPHTMTEVARMHAPSPRTATTKSTSTATRDAAPPKRSSRKWPGCGHRRFAGEDKCRFCAAQVLIPDVAGSKPQPA